MTYPSATLSPTNTKWNGTRLDPGRCDDRLATNCLSHGTAVDLILLNTL
jgi:hypothetical protein